MGAVFVFPEYVLHCSYPRNHYGHSLRNNQGICIPSVLLYKDRCFLISQSNEWSTCHFWEKGEYDPSRSIFLLLSIHTLMVYRHYLMMRHNSLGSSITVCYHPILSPYSLLTLPYQHNKQFVNEPPYWKIPRISFCVKIT